MEKIKLFSCFSGYGIDIFALKQLNIPFECIGYSEIDKYACKCFEQNHSYMKTTYNLDQTLTMPKNYGDISKINWNEVPDFDLLTGGFPCTDVSVAGKKDLSKGRTILGFELTKALKIKQPKYFLFENVKGLLSKKFKPFLDELLKQWSEVGYHVYYKVLNTREHGIPQNRERVFFVGFRFDKDTFKEGYNFTFPDKEELKIFIKDILEPEPVDQKYYLKPEQVKKIEDALIKKLEKKKYSDTITNGGRHSLCKKHNWDLVKVEWDIKNNMSNQYNRAYSVDGCSPCLQATHTANNTKIFQSVGDRDNPSISIKEDIANCIPSNPMSDRNQIVQINKHCFRTGKRGNCVKEAPSSFTLDSSSGNDLIVVNTQPRSENRPSLVNGTSQGGSGIIYKEDGTTYCVDTNNTQANGLSKTNIFRRLTPKECFRLQGFINDEVKLDGLSDTQKYKLCGNGQSVNVVAKIFERMFKNGN